MPEKLRALLDTNIYGLLFEPQNRELFDLLAESNKTKIYGFSVIRKELRQIRTSLMVNNRNVRNAVLQIYGTLTKENSYEVTPQIVGLAKEYISAYDGGISIQKLWNDFLIVACASIHGLDVIVSEDKHSMMSSPALRAFEKVNRSRSLAVPKFYTIEDLEQLV